MLVKLQYNDIVDSWDTLKVSIAKALSARIPISDTVMNNVLSALLDNDMQCWVFQEKDKLIATLTTTILKDKPVGLRSLLVYSITGMERISDEQWRKGFETLRKFAKSQNCWCVSGYTRSERIVEVVTELLGGFSDNYVVLEA